MSDDPTLVPETKIKIQGSPLADELAYNFQWCEVRQSIRLIDMCVICFQNPAGLLADRTEFKQGNEVTVELGYVGDLKWAFKGDIVSIEPDFPVSGTPNVIVRCYDRLHRYRRGRKQRTFLSQKVSDVVQTLGGEDGLSADVEDTGLQHDYLLQNNQTNIDYIHELARRYGYEVDVTDDGSKLQFKKPRYDKPKAKSLKWRENLKSFYVRKSVDNVPTEVSCRYWNMKDKKHVVETHKTVHGELASQKLAFKEAERAFGAAKLQVSLRQCAAPVEAQGVATTVFNERSLDAVKARATAIGDGSLQPGQVIELLALGKTWSGEYYITATSHLMHRGSGFTTELELRRTGWGYDFEAEMVEPPAAPAAAEPAQGSSLGASLGHA